jgi:hypothetical protein
MNKQAYERMVGMVLNKSAGVVDVVTSLVAAGSESYLRNKETEDRIKLIDEEIAHNDKAIQQLQATGSNSVAIRKYVDRNIQLQEEKSKLKQGINNV